MEINRKRVAKRLVSGLVASAFALGGLAITGASPAGATTPAWNPFSDRIGGADRYETAVDAAIDAGRDNLIIASGENPADALAAAAIVGAEDASVILVKHDSIPDYVADYLASRADDEMVAYVVGGEAAISEDVFDAVADTLDSWDVSRLSGDDRYETAAAINAEIVNPEGAIIVNGADGRWPDALSIGQVAALLEWPIIVTGNGGLNATAEAQIDELLLDDEEASFILVGGTSVLPSSVEDYLRDAGVAQGSIRRLAGADRYGTNVMVNAYILEGGTSALVAFLGGDASSTAESPFGLFAANAGVNVTLVSGEAPWDALAANSWTTSGTPSHLVLTKANSVPPLTGIALGLLGSTEKTTGLYVIGGRSAVSESTRIAAMAALNTDIDGPTLSGCVEGSYALVADFTGLGSTAKDDGDGMLEIVGGSLDDIDLVDENGDSTASDSLTDPAGLGEWSYELDVSESLLYKAQSHVTVNFLISVEDGSGGYEWEDYALQIDDEVVVSHFQDDAIQAIGESTCSVVEDDTAPTIVSMVAEETRVLVTTSEPVYAGEDGILLVAYGDAAGDEISDRGYTSATGDFSIGCALAEAACLTNSWVVYPDADLTDGERYQILAGSFVDRAGNANEDVATDRASADETDPVLTKVASFCENTASASWVIDTNGGTDGITLSYNNMLASLASETGVEGNEWTVEVVDDRGGDSVSVAIDTADKALTLTLDVGYHTAADIYAAMISAGATGLLGSWTVSASDWAGTVDEEGDVSIAEGTMNCTVVISHSEPSYAAWGDAAIDTDEVGGANENYALNLSILTFVGLTEAGEEIELNGIALQDDAATPNEGSDRLTFNI